MADFAVDPDPQAKAELATKVWGNLWHRDGRPADARLRGLLAQLRLPHAEAPEVRVCGDVLYRRARAAARKAAGCDDWSGRLWRALPLEFFVALADIWNSVLAGAPIPESWTQVRICLIPKEEGGQRPLAIAALAWRLGASAVVQQLNGWIRTVFPHELYGGLPERSIADVHYKLTHALFVQQAGGPLAGCKADVRKCFDTADPRLAVLCLRALGAPESMLDVIGRFYEVHTRWLSVDGMFARHPVVGAAALLQGCPFSPLCLNAMMAVWLARVKEAGTHCNLAVYLDDRTIWIRQRRGAALAVHAAMQAGASADEALGFSLHPNKLESFGTTQTVREELMAVADDVGTPQATFKLLGVPYNVTKAHPVATSGITTKLEGRCKRIQLCGQSYSIRRALLARLVIPLFRWCAPWLRHLKKLTARWAGAIERAVWGGAIPRGRSRALAWTTFVGLQYFPDYVNAEATVLQEHRRLLLGRHPQEAPNTRAAFSYFGWQRAGDLWTCRQGSFLAGTLSAAALRRLLRRDGALRLFKADPKAKQEGGVTHDFDLAHHQALAAVVEGYSARVMVGGASDARHIVAASEDYTLRLCECGHPGPTRTHLTFECPNEPWTLEMRTALERRLLLPLCPALPCWDVADYSEGIAEVARFLTTLDVDAVHLVASDGGCLIARGAEPWQRASWAIAFADATFGGLVIGPEQTAAAGERTAVFVLASALLRCGRRLRLLIDNQAVAGRLRGGSAACDKGDPFLVWQVIGEAAEWLSACWIPSHGKRCSWQPPEGWGTAELCRGLNAAADGRATLVLAPFKEDVAAAAQAAASRRRWARMAVARQAELTEDFHREFINFVAALRAKRRSGLHGQATC